MCVLMHIHAYICVHEYAYKYICISKLCCANEDKKLVIMSQEKPCSGVLRQACRP